MRIFTQCTETAQVGMMKIMIDYENLMERKILEKNCCTERTEGRCEESKR